MNPYHGGVIRASASETAEFSFQGLVYISANIAFPSFYFRPFGESRAWLECTSLKLR